MSAPADFRHSHHPRKKLSDEHGSPFAVAHSLHPPSSARAGVACSTFHMTMPVPRSRISGIGLGSAFPAPPATTTNDTTMRINASTTGTIAPLARHAMSAPIASPNIMAYGFASAAASCLRRGCIAEKMPVHPRISTLFSTIASAVGAASKKPRPSKPETAFDTTDPTSSASAAPQQPIAIADRGRRTRLSKNVKGGVKNSRSRFLKPFSRP